MRHIVFDDQSRSFPVALLIKNSAFNGDEIRRVYLSRLEAAGVSKADVIGFTLEYDHKGKASVSYMKDYLGNLLSALKALGTTTLYCADAAYFKVLTKVNKAEPNLGYVLPCAIEGFEEMQVILGVNHKSLIYNPANEAKLEMSIQTLVDHVSGSYSPLGEDIIHFADYPKTSEQIKNWLDRLHNEPKLTMDIEAVSLNFIEAGVATITFCWDEHNGIAFPVDYVAMEEPDEQGNHGVMVPNSHVRKMLREFFESYQGEMIWHNSPYDTKVLIFNLWMKNTLDNSGLLKGLHTLYKRTHDTKIIAYLATNSTAGNKLSLKDLAHEFAGNWAQEDIKNILRIPLPQLLQYNLVDGLSTFYVFKKFYPLMQADNQELLYHTLMMPSQKVITQIELTGMPMYRDKVALARQELEGILNQHLSVFQGKSIIKELEKVLTDRAWEKDFEDRKAKAKNPDKILPKDRDHFPLVPFNPNSNNQLQVLLYELMELPVLDLTDSKQPATGADTLEKLIHHTDNQDYQDILDSLVGYGKAVKVLSSFIPAFEKAPVKEDGHTYLHGSFNLGGTVSGRLSSSNPNMQNIPSGSVYGKLIKKCFGAPKGNTQIDQEGLAGIIDSLKYHSSGAKLCQTG